MEKAAKGIVLHMNIKYLKTVQKPKVVFYSRMSNIGNGTQAKGSVLYQNDKYLQKAKQQELVNLNVKYLQMAK